MILTLPTVNDGNARAIQAFDIAGSAASGTTGGNAHALLADRTDSYRSAGATGVPTALASLKQSV
jgi:hypothetical protein